MTEKTNLSKYTYENELREKGIKWIAGVDEVGRGPLAGPVVTAAVILPNDYTIEGIDDSKKLSIKKRDLLYDEIIEKAISYSVAFISEKVIDEINIYEATKVCMLKAIENLSIKPEHVLIDAMPLEKLTIPHTSIIKGDALSASIGAASIVAKVTRDRFMDEMDKEYPEYGFRFHKGYPTKMHLEAIEKYGLTPIHRRSYAPCQRVQNKQLSLEL